MINNLKLCLEYRQKIFCNNCQTIKCYFELSTLFFFYFLFATCAFRIMNIVYGSLPGALSMYQKDSCMENDCCC